MYQTLGSLPKPLFLNAQKTHALFTPMATGGKNPPTFGKRGFSVKQLSTHPALEALDAASLPPLEGRPNLLGTSLEELEDFVQRSGQPLYRGKQLFSWIFNRRVTDFDHMTNMPKTFRAAMAEHFELTRPLIDTCAVSTDGTRKYRFVAKDGTAFESVYIPEVGQSERTNTLCISSQSGCAVGCKFCFTASLRRNRNLSAAEIVGQVLAVRDDVAQLGDHAKVTNIVFMGMGEPLLNYTQVVRAAQILVHPLGPGFSTRRVTISTSGIVPRIYDLGRDVPTQLAISLNATTNEIRSHIMPINKKWPLEELLQAMRDYPLAPRRKITVEYVMLGGVNDRIEDAQRLTQILQGIPVKINLLPLNPHDRTPFSPPTEQSVAQFKEVLRRAGYHALLRTARGQDIAAACGQLGETVSLPEAS